MIYGNILRYFLVEQKHLTVRLSRDPSTINFSDKQSLGSPKFLECKKTHSCKWAFCCCCVNKNYAIHLMSLWTIIEIRSINHPMKKNDNTTKMIVSTSLLRCIRVTIPKMKFVIGIIASIRETIQLHPMYALCCAIFYLLNVNVCMIILAQM